MRRQEQRDRKLRAKKPATGGQARKSPQSAGQPDWMVAHAFQVEPVSAGKFPANREINREFCKIQRSATNLRAWTRANPMACSEIPCSAEQGIFAKEQGICTLRTGNFSRQVTITAGRGF
jgi:hypothetical protein